MSTGTGLMVAGIWIFVGLALHSPLVDGAMAALISAGACGASVAFWLLD